MVREIRTRQRRDDVMIMAMTLSRHIFVILGGIVNLLLETIKWGN